MDIGLRIYHRKYSAQIVQIAVAIAGADGGRVQPDRRDAVKLAPAGMQKVIRGLQAMRGIAEISA